MSQRRVAAYRIIGHIMTKSPMLGDGISPARRRRIIQIVFIFVNLALVEAHLPGPLWLAIGAIFWIALLGVTVAGSSIVCGTMCWIGAIQDIFEPLARPRLRLDAKFGRALTLLVLALWMPAGWLLAPELAAHDRMPIDLSLGWERHVFQFALATLTAFSVVLLGKRGICRYLCPFNSIVATVRTLVARRPRRVAVAPCAGGCAGCSRRDAPILEGSQQ